MEESSGEANRSSTIQEIPCILWNPEVHYCIDRSLPPVSFLSQINLVHAIHLTSSRSILLLSSHFPSGLFSSGFPTKTLYAPLLSLIHTTCPNPFHSSWFDHSNYIRWGVQFIKLLIMPRKPYFVCGNGVLLARCLQISQYYLIWNGMNWRPVLPIRAVCSNKLSLYRQTLSYMTGKDSIRTAQ